MEKSIISSPIHWLKYWDYRETLYAGVTSLAHSVFRESYILHGPNDSERDI